MLASAIGKRGHELGQRLGIEPRVAFTAAGVAGHQHVASERLAVEECPARETQRRIELALKGGLEPGDVDAKIAQQAPGDGAVKRFRRLQRLAAAIADDAAAIEAEFVPLGVAAKIVVIVENQDTGGWLGTMVEPRRRKPTDTAADHDEVVGLVDRQAINRKFALFSCERMGYLE